MEALTMETFNEKILDTKEDALILFVKEGCPICQEMHPLMEEIEQGYAGQPFHFYVVDAIEQEELYRSIKPQGTPTTILYHDGEMMHKFTGLREYEEIEFLIDRTMIGK